MLLSKLKAEYQLIKIYKNGTVISYSPAGRSAPVDAKRRGSVEKKFVLTWTHYRELASSAVIMWETKTHKLTFWTFTFREGSITYPDAVKIWSKFQDNLKKTYRCKAILWTGELTKKGTPHFHAICDVPYLDLAAVTEAWNKCRNDWSKSGVRLPKNKNTGKTTGSVVKSLDSLVNYMCKYIAKTARDSQGYVDKSTGEVFPALNYGARCWGRSRHLCKTSITYTTYEDAAAIVSYLNRQPEFKRWESKYCAIYSPTGPPSEARKKLKNLPI